ncbi:ATP-binding protein [Bacillus cereus group sp. BY112LC]|uniref:AlbA family DNA-binding domain-containing protein n=1 Tax=Bacillus cereus group sp. BY112LC TaxID=3018086 RepID=UPI0022E34BEB|nr:ATP-binding protein [Bacillus cereus group sp. BY112LC]MDA1876393.1 ATP-binding protein [Bacillus cereus group sp. BY112LC]
MYFGKPIDQVTFEDIQSLVDDGVMENRLLDYKRDIPNNIRGDYKREFCKDIVAFANTEGGTLIYGIEEIEDSQPNIVGVDISNIDIFLQQATSVIRTNIEPALYDFKFNPIPIGQENKYVLCIDIPKSWAGPHAVKVGDFTYRFFTRVNTSNVGLDIPGIQNSFLSNEELTNKIRSFPKGRNLQILTKENALPIEGPFLSLHLIPRQSFTATTNIDLQSVADSSGLLSPIFAHRYDYRYNLDGYMYYSASEGTNPTYNQIFRNGILEIVTNRSISLHSHDVDNIRGSEIILELIQAIPRFIEFYKSVGINTDIYGFLSFYNIKSHKLHTGEGISPEEITQHYINLPEFIIKNEHMEDIQSHLRDILQFPLDVLWNAFGLQRCSRLENTLESLRQQEA